MRRINYLLVASCIVFLAYGEDITERLELYVDREVEKQGEVFKKELDRCLKVAQKYGDDPQIEQIIKQKGCKEIFDQYEKLIEKATIKYSSEIDLPEEEIKKQLREK